MKTSAPRARGGPRHRPPPDSARLVGEIRCPACGRASFEEMGFDYSLYFYRCPFSDVVIQSRRGDCCVFRSYGTVPICLCDPIESQNPRSTH